MDIAAQELSRVGILLPSAVLLLVPLIPVVAACVKDARPSRWLAPLERLRWPQHRPRVAPPADPSLSAVAGGPEASGPVDLYRREAAGACAAPSAWMPLRSGMILEWNVIDSNRYSRGLAECATLTQRASHITRVRGLAECATLTQRASHITRVAWLSARLSHTRRRASHPSPTSRGTAVGYASCFLWRARALPLREPVLGTRLAPAGWSGSQWSTRPFA